MSKKCTFTLNSTNIVPVNGFNDRLVLRFPSRFFLPQNYGIALTAGSLNYSWGNINDFFNNNTFSYTWLGSTYTVNMGNVYFLVSDINNYLHLIMKQNGHYLIDNTGNEIYYLNVQNNYTVYGNTITATPLPSSLPSGWSNPASVPLSAPNAITPQLVVSSNNFGQLIGFNPGSYPSVPQTSVYQTDSSFAPKLSPVLNPMIHCNFINVGNYTQYRDVVSMFVPQVQYGQPVDLSPKNLQYLDCISGTYDELIITFTDEYNRPLRIQDSQIVLQFSLQPF